MGLDKDSHVQVRAVELKERSRGVQQFPYLKYQKCGGGERKGEA